MYANVHKTKKRTREGPFSCFVLQGLIVVLIVVIVVIVAAFTTWVAWRAAVLIVRAAPWVLVRRMTWIAALRTIAYGPGRIFL